MEASQLWIQNCITLSCLHPLYFGVCLWNFTIETYFSLRLRSFNFWKKKLLRIYLNKYCLEVNNIVTKEGVRRRGGCGLEPCTFTEWGIHCKMFFFSKKTPFSCSLQGENGMLSLVWIYRMTTLDLPNDRFLIIEWLSVI